MDTTNYKVAAGIAANIADEETAIKGYYELLSTLIDPNDILEIKEIISDEKNHAQKLKAILLKYDGNVPTATD